MDQNSLSLPKLTHSLSLETTMANPSRGRKTQLLLCLAMANPTMGFDSCMLLGFDRACSWVLIVGIELEFWSCMLLSSAVAGISKPFLLFNFWNLGFEIGVFNSFFQIGFLIFETMKLVVLHLTHCWDEECCIWVFNCWDEECCIWPIFISNSDNFSQTRAMPKFFSSWAYYSFFI